MERKGKKVILALLCVFSLCQEAAFSQQQNDEESKLVRLLSADKASIVEENGITYRKVVGSARFFHNNTYFLCDTAYWNVATNIIDAWGNVSLLQDETVLTSERLVYQVDSSLAQFRGSLVQLLDKDNNTLRTRHLDYFTDDSVAVFFNGASMRDKDGQIIESVEGKYESKKHLFTFLTDVNMFSDTTFIRSNRLEYYTDRNIAYFTDNIDAWHSDNMLASSYGYYDRENEIFFFNKNVHLQSPDKEGWADSLYIYRQSGNLLMQRNAQLTNTENGTHALADRIDYTDSTKVADMSADPAIVAEINQDGEVDTLYIRANRLIQLSRLICDMKDSLFREKEEKFLAEINVDPVGEYRAKAAKEAAEAAAKKAAEDPNNAYKQSKEFLAKQEARKADSLARVQRQADSIARAAFVADSIWRASMDSTELARLDSIAALPVKDSTKVNFVRGIGRVKLFRKNIQVVCDSLLYNDFDSLARLFIDPVIWSENNRQFNADSMYFVVEDGRLKRLNMMSNAFVHLQEQSDTNFFNQIRGAEMTAFFDTTSALQRYDAMGDATALFYMQENDVIATANKMESKMLSANFVNGEISKVHFYSAPKSNAFPLASMQKDDYTIKGFMWNPSLRPKSPADITTRTIRASERAHYNKVGSPEFKYTNIFFPGYIADINRQIAVRDSLKKLGPQPQDAIPESELKRADRVEDAVDSVVNLVTAAVDTTVAPAVDSTAVAADSLSLSSKADSLSISAKDEVAAEKTAAELKAEQKAKKAAEREAKREQRRLAKEARWAEQDAKSKAREEAAAQKKLERERKNKRRALQDQMDREAWEESVIQKYLDAFHNHPPKKKKLQN